MNYREISRIMSGCRVGIAGAGGLGSNCAAALVRCGLGTLVIADSDVVDHSNLNRQFYFLDQVGMPKTEALRINLLRINPELMMETHQTRVNPVNIGQIFGEVDLLIEAFDAAEEKAMLIENALYLWPERALVAGVGMAGYGNSETIRFRRTGNLYICGDESSEIAEELPPLAPRVGMVASLQANIALEILLNRSHLITGT